jgi:hypothetical protein
MMQFFVSLAIVLTGVVICIDWAKVIHASLERMITWLGNATEKALFALVVLPANYLAGYAYKGKHHRDNSRQPTDSEVDRWRGADDNFADFLHTLNLDIHMNDQARA